MRDLDVRVAKARGWKNLHWSEEVDTEDHYNPADWYGDEPIGDGEYRKGVILHSRYSTDIAQAFELVEELNEKYHLQLRSPFFPGADWFAGFTQHNTPGWNGRPDFEAGAKAAPEAICLGYLKVKESE